MEYSFGFGTCMAAYSLTFSNSSNESTIKGCINFLFGLPAIRTIDTLGRRKWLTMTLPVMCLFMMAAAVSFPIKNEDVKIGVVAMWLYLFAAAYSPGLGKLAVCQHRSTS